VAMASSPAPQNTFRHVLPPDHLGTRHISHQAFCLAVNYTSSREKEYSLVVVTDSEKQRILLGEKHRGFGTGMYNSFGGKLEREESATASACRELEEETGIVSPLSIMEESHVGTLRFTFEDSETEMVVHLFRVNVTISASGNDKSGGPALQSGGRTFPIAIKSDTIRGCDEITPFWVDNWSAIPFDNMFADDSLWLPALLSGSDFIRLDGWFHFQAGGQNINSISHWYMDINDNPA
jgi:8-oxo-dGTP pyrophosphatase MutT (NUDIX family)